MKSLVYAFLDLLFPETCLGCHTRGAIICEKCVILARSAERETSRNIVALYDYRDPLVKRAIWHLKYYNKRHLGERLGSLLYEGTLEDISDMREISSGQPIIVIPVPMSQKRRRKRGYNQAEIIARHFCRAGGSELFELQTDIVNKKINVLPQARIKNRTRRLKNIRDAFLLKDTNKIAGRTCIVIDDVTTTGATMEEIIKLLKSSGAKRAVGFAFAH